MQTRGGGSETEAPDASAPPRRAHSPHLRRAGALCAVAGAAAALTLGGGRSTTPRHVTDRMPAPHISRTAPHTSRRTSQTALIAKHRERPAHHHRNARAEQPHHDIRIISHHHLEMLLDHSAVSRQVAKELFDNKRTYVAIVDPQQDVPAHWNAQVALMVTSYAELKKEMAHGLPSNISAIIYDNEMWDLTPPAERANPNLYAGKIEKLAKKHNLVFIAAPSLDPRLVAGDARHADIIDLQLQGMESNPALFNSQAHALAAEVRALNPGIDVVAEVTSNPDKACPPSGASCGRDDMQRAVNDLGRAHGVIDGWWPWLYDTAVGRKGGLEIVKMLAHREHGGKHL